MRSLALRLPPPWPPLRCRASPLPPLSRARAARACSAPATPAGADAPAAPDDAAAPAVAAPAKSSGRLYRIDQTLSRLGYCSRGDAPRWVRSGRVTVRGARPARADAKALLRDMAVDGAPLEHPHGMLLLLHKPAGVVCSHDAGEGPRVFDLLPERWRDRSPVLTTVGRLDKDTTGALLLTDLGELVQAWTSPKRKVPKLYRAQLDGPLPPHAEAAFADGRIVLDGSPCAPALLTRRQEGPACADVALTEGRYHQVKRMFAAVGCTVLSLHRVRFGDFGVEGLAPGQWRVLPLPPWSAAAAVAAREGDRGDASG